MSVEITIKGSDGRTTIDTIVLDATATETHDVDVEVTDHPVEEGSPVVDHARAKPNALVVKGIVTNTPIGRAQKSRLDARASVRPELVNGAAKDAEIAFSKLMALAEDPKFVTVTTRLKTYENMIMMKLSVPREAKSGDACEFSATFRRVRVVSNRVSRVAIAKEPRGNGKGRGGKQVTKTADDKTKKKSILYQLGDSLGLTDKLGITKKGGK